MKRVTVIAMLTLFTSLQLQAQQGIKELKDKAAFENAMARNEKMVVIFVAELCDYCKGFLPKVENIVEDYEEIKFFRINYDENADFFAYESIEATPTVKIYKNGVKIDEMITVALEPLQQKLRDF